MSLQNVSNHKQLLIAKNIPRTANLAGAVATPSNLADGEVVVTDLAGRILTITTAALGTVQSVVIVQGQGATKPLIKSNPIPKSVFSARVQEYVPAAQQVSNVGYNGTSGNIVNPGVGTSIILRNTFKTNFYQFSDKLMESIVGYRVTAADTILTIADALTKRAIQDVQKYVNIPFKVERESNGTYGTTTASVAATKSSSVLTGTGVGTANPVGTRVRIGASNASTTPVYVVTAASANSITIDTAYQGATATVNVYTNTVAPTAIGIQFTGLPQAKFAPNIFRYETSKFVTTATNFSTTEVINAAQVPTEGSGVYEQIAEEEFFFQLGEGMHDNALIQVPPVTMRSNVELTGTYSILDIEFANQSGTMSFINNPMARKQVRIAANILGGIATDAQANVVTSGVTGSEATGIREVLNAFVTGGVTNSFAV
jgi:hypothetical protein